MSDFSVGDVYVSILPSAKDFADRLRKAILPDADRVGGEAGDVIRAKIDEKIKDIRVTVKASVDKSSLGSEIKSLPGSLKTELDSAGQDIGSKLGESASSGAGGSLQAGAIGVAVLWAGTLVPAAVGLIGAGLVAGIAGYLDKGVPAFIVPFMHLTHDLNSELHAAARQLAPVFGTAFTGLDQEVKSLAPEFNQLFDSAAPFVSEIIPEFGKMGAIILPALTGVINEITPELPTMLQGFTDLAGGTRDFLQELGPGMKASADVFQASARLVQGIMIGLGYFFTHTAQAADLLVHGVHNLGSGFSHTSFNAIAMGDATVGAKPKVVGLSSVVNAAATAQWALGTSIAAVTTDIGNQIGPLLTSQGDWVSWKQAQDSAKTAIDKVHGSLNGQGAAALAADQAIITSTTNVISFAKSQNTTETGVRKASNAIQDQINFLETHAGKSKIAAKEIAALIATEARIRANINQSVLVTGKGSFKVIHVGSELPQGTAGAAGMMVTGGIPGQDSVHILGMPGELMVPVPIVQSGAVDHLRGMIPGFEAGGVVGSYSGAPDGAMGKWLQGNDSATVNALSSAVASALSSALAATPPGTGGGHGFPGGGTPGGGSAAANAALARVIFPWPASMFPAYNAVEMREAGYNLTAQNPTSGAYGMAQFINGPSEYYQWGGNPSTAAGQLVGMFNYIRSRYGNPLGAEAHEQAFGWYDTGGYLPPGVSMAFNGTGRPEPVLSDAQWGMIASATRGGDNGTEYHAHFDGLTTQAIESTVRGSFRAMEMQGAQRERVGRAR